MSYNQRNTVVVCLVGFRFVDVLIVIPAVIQIRTRTALIRAT